MKIKLLHSLVVFILFSNYCFSQSNKVELNYSRPPLNSLKADDMWNFTLKNNSTQELEFTLNGTLTESKAGLIATGQTMALSLRKGETKKFKISDLPKTPDINYIHSDPRYKEALMRKGSLPDGNYTICVYAKQTGTNEELGNDCLEQEITIEKDASITLLTPDNNENINPSDAMTFSWAVLGAKTAGHYKIKIVEITGDESPENAMLKNKAFFEKEDIRTSTFQYPTSAPKFKEGKYVWRVFVGDTKSEIYSFRKDSEDSKKQFTNPYEVSTMKYVYSKLRKEGRIKKDIALIVTHHHIKFMPQNEKELTLLNSDSALMFYPYPLNKDVAQSEENSTNSLYCVVDADHQLPNIKHEILSELFLNRRGINNELVLDELSWNILEFEALRYTNSFPNIPAIPNKLTPSGSVPIYDNTFLIYWFGRCKN